MRRGSSTSRDAHYAAAESWATDRQDWLRASRRVAWIVAAAAVLVAVCEAFALLFLLPLKTVVPYTLMVDRQTGFVQLLKPLDAQEIAASDALTESFLVQYVIAREGYDADTDRYDQYRVGLWSSPPVAADYVAQRRAAALHGLSRSSVVNVEIKSVTQVFRGRPLYMVRFRTVRRDAGGAERPAANWAAIIRYTRSGAPMTIDQRRLNPLGFRVTDYRRSAETAPVPESAVAVSPTPQPSVGPDGSVALAGPSTGHPPMPSRPGS